MFKRQSHVSDRSFLCTFLYAKARFKTDNEPNWNVMLIKIMETCSRGFDKKFSFSKGCCYKVWNKRTTNSAGSFCVVTCSAKGYVVLRGKWTAGRLFPASGAPAANSLRKALMTPHWTQTTTVTCCTSPILQRLLDTCMHFSALNQSNFTLLKLI